MSIEGFAQTIKQKVQTLRQLPLLFEYTRVVHEVSRSLPCGAEVPAANRKQAASRELMGLT